MTKLRKQRFAQSMLEYAMIFTIVSAALIAMHTYVNRAVNARLKQVQQDFYENYENE